MERTKQQLNDQLIAIRIDKHNAFIQSSKVAKNELNKENVSAQGSDNVKKSVIVCGDSIVNGLDGRGSSSKQANTIVRSFPGATSRDLVDYIKPLVSKKPKKIIFWKLSKII